MRRKYTIVFGKRKKPKSRIRKIEDAMRMQLAFLGGIYMREDMKHLHWLMEDIFKEADLALNGNTRQFGRWKRDMKRKAKPA